MILLTQVFHFGKNRNYLRVLFSQKQFFDYFQKKKNHGALQNTQFIIKF
jgi:hypothetical protein